MPTTIAGKYEVLERIGGSGDATVFRVRHLLRQEIRALRVQTDPESSARVREARALARLRHPHIVQVFDVGRDGDRYYVEMEYVDGSSLAQRLRTTGRLPLREALTVVRQVADALAYAHAHARIDSSGTPRIGMVHGDVKTSNVLLRRGDDTRALLVDFALVKPSETSDRVDQRADLVSLGHVLFELIEGRPLAGSESPSFASPVDPELEALVHAMIEEQPDERLAGGMADVMRALDRVIARLSAPPGADAPRGPVLVARDVVARDVAARDVVARDAIVRDAPAPTKPETPRLEWTKPAPPPARPTPRRPTVRVAPAVPPAPPRARVPASSPGRRPWLATAAILVLGVVLVIVLRRLAPERTPAVDPVATATGSRSTDGAPVTMPTPTTLPPAAVEQPDPAPEPAGEPSVAELVPGGPVIVGRTPVEEEASVVLGQSLLLGVQLAAEAEARPHRYAWFLDGRPIGSDSTWRYRPSRAVRPVRIEVEVTDESAATSERIAWTVGVRTAPPRILEVRPANRELHLAFGQPGELFVRATPGRPGAPLRYEWRIDRLPARITKIGTLAVPDDLTVGRHTIEVVAVDDEEDRKSAPRRFTIIVAAAGGAAESAR